MQFNYWCDPGDVNVSNLSRVEYIVSDTDFYIVLKQLPKKLREIQPLIPKEGDNIYFFTSTLTAADTAASPTNFKAYYHADIRLYMEACLIANRMKRASPAVCRPRLLVTEDFKFFKGFVRSAHAHDILRDLVVSVLKISEGVTVLLAGEIIDGV